MAPNIQSGYARSGDITIAYQVAGEGPPMVYVPGFVSHVELNWEAPFYRRAFERATRFCRVITFDKRGTGLSDRVASLGTIEERMDDIRAVMDAQGIERAAFFAMSEGGPLSLLFAATYPERVSRLGLYATFPKLLATPDHPAGIPEDAGQRFVDLLTTEWGSGKVLERFVQHAADRAASLATMSRWERMVSTPAIALQILRSILDIDVRAVLPTIHVPTLVIHAKGDPIIPATLGRYMAEHLPDCRGYVELDADFHASWREEDQDAVMDPFEEFITGQITSKLAPSRRMLTTIVFTDIVESTRRARELGDAKWREVLESHFAMARQEVERFRGRLVETTGDGILACFDGPARALRCAQRLVERAPESGLAIRVGVHTGECEESGNRLIGLTLHLAARVMAIANAGEILVTRMVRDLVGGSGICFQERGAHLFKGFESEIPVSAVDLSRANP